MFCWLQSSVALYFRKKYESNKDNCVTNYVFHFANELNHEFISYSKM